jgi:hypothetical protein
LTALEALGEELTGKGVRGQIFIVGGAAMALAYSTRRVTKDIDAVFEPKRAIYAAAAKVAEDLMAMRFGENDEDIEILLRECGVRSAQAALDLLGQVYPQHEPPPKTRFFLEQLLGA